ncbi:MAG TPA: hypothetical protein VGF08_04275 [Terriglobales bacterium]|jgi:hypothetical protein
MNRFPAISAALVSSFALGLVLAALHGQSQPAVNADSLVLKEFDQRVDDYLKLRKKLQVPRPKVKPSASAVSQAQLELAAKIRMARSKAAQGDIFIPNVAPIFRKLLAQPLHSGDGAKVRSSLRDGKSEHPAVPGINQSFPGGSAIPSAPPTLLSNLPKLPEGIEYRVVGQELVLLDTEANLIVDILPDALPAAAEAGH